MKADSREDSRWPPSRSRDDRLRSVRIPYVRRCSLSHERGRQNGFLLDLSMRGVYVTTHPLLPTGLAVRLSFGLLGFDRELLIAGTVSWLNAAQTHPVHGLPPGCGIVFREIAEEQSRLVRATIETYCRSNPMYRRYL